MYKQCNRCGSEHRITQYYPDIDTCKPCLRTQALAEGMPPDRNISAGMFRTRKTCSTCQQCKPLDQYNVDRKVKDGRAAECKECSRARTLRWQATPQGKAKLKAYADSGSHARARRKHYHENRDKYLAKAKEPGQRAKQLERQRRWRERNRHKTKAHDAVRYRVRTGQLARPETLPCVQCGEQATEYHHPDYSRLLEVQAMCHPCHLALHRKHP